MKTLINTIKTNTLNNKLFANDEAIKEYGFKNKQKAINLINERLNKNYDKSLSLFATKQFIIEMINKDLVNEEELNTILKHNPKKIKTIDDYAKEYIESYNKKVEWEKKRDEYIEASNKRFREAQAQGIKEEVKKQVWKVVK